MDEGRIEGVNVRSEPVPPGVTSGEVNDIFICKALNGYIVRCGCQSVVFESKERMLFELSRYWDNPSKIEKEYLDKYR